MPHPYASHLTRETREYPTPGKNNQETTTWESNRQASTKTKATSSHDGITESRASVAGGFHILGYDPNPPTPSTLRYLRSYCFRCREWDIMSIRSWGIHSRGIHILGIRTDKQIQTQSSLGSYYRLCGIGSGVS